MGRAEGKVVVVTGGNSGIGRGIAEKFGKEGAKVVIFGRDPKTLVETKERLPKECLSVQGDVTKTDDLQNLFSQTVERFGKIDVLTPCAGVSKRVHIENASEKDFDHLVSINYRGLFFTIKYALPFLKERASIVFIASIAAYTSVKELSIYSSSKAAVVRLARNLASDLAERKIRVNSISPGYIKTPIFDRYLEKEPDFLEKRAENTLLKRIGTPEDIANAALFLSSDEASYITGTDLIVDGGLLAS